MNDYTFKDSKYFDVFIKNRKTGTTTTFRMCQNLDFAFNKDLGTYVLEFLCCKKWHFYSTNDYIITID